MAKCWPDEQEAHEADALGEEANISKARSLHGKRVGICDRHKQESRCVIPGEICVYVESNYSGRQAAGSARRSQPRP